MQSWCDETPSDDVPIIDYHCHPDDKAIKEDKTFSDIGELWLSGDHYKWRAVRLCCVSEDYITGYKSINGKFCKLTEIIRSLRQPRLRMGSYGIKADFRYN